VRKVGETGQATMQGDDLVHLDFHPENVLVDEDGSITGIVDWDGIARGDRRFMLVTLRFSAAPLGADPDTVAWLDRLIDDWLDRPTLRAYWAAMSLRQVDWAIRHFGPSEVERELTLAESRIPV
jgi:aminoglycoside phosphotransferase (APT) family kinase protein